MKTILVKSILFLGFLLSLSQLLAVENQFFKTYAEFKAGKGTKFDEIPSLWSSGFGKGITITFEMNGQNEKVQSNDIWGFVYKDALYRIAVLDQLPVKLISNGKIHYYENGWAHIIMARNGTTEGDVLGSKCYVSENIYSEIINLPENKVVKKLPRIVELMASFPEYVTLFECMGKGYDIERIRKCISTFEAKK